MTISPEYMVADGFNIPLIDLSVIYPQGKCQGVRATLRSNAISGRVTDQGLYILFEWNVLESAVMYQNLLDQFGVKTALYNNVTIYARNSVLVWSRYNGRAIQPEVANDFDWNNFRLRNLKLLVRNLKPST